jgi:hypothetical protein
MVRDDDEYKPDREWLLAGPYRGHGGLTIQLNPCNIIVAHAVGDRFRINDRDVMIGTRGRVRALWFALAGYWPPW